MNEERNYETEEPSPFEEPEDAAAQAREDRSVKVFEEQRRPPAPPVAPLRSSTPPPPPPTARDRDREDRPSFFWPIVLIGFGVLLLLSNMGVFPATGWAVLWRFWPIALIALGIDVMIGRRSTAGAIASGILILLLVGLAIGAALFAEQIPALMDLTAPAVLQYEEVAYPLGEAARADVRIDWTSVPGTLEALEDSTNLIEADIAYRGNLNFDARSVGDRATVSLDTYQGGVIFTPGRFEDREARWQVGLSPRVPIDLDLDGGSESYTFDLSALEIIGLVVDVGSGDVNLHLPTASSFSGTIDGGSGRLTLRLPENVGLRLELDSGSGSFAPGDRLVITRGERGNESVWETRNYDAVDYHIELEIDQGSGALVIE